MQRSWAEDDDSAPRTLAWQFEPQQAVGTHGMMCAVRRRVYVYRAGPLASRHTGDRQPRRRCSTRAACHVEQRH